MDSMDTTGDDDIDDVGAKDGAAFMRGLPPLESSVLPHHATRQVKSAGLYQTPRALVGRQMTSSWATSSSVAESVASSDISVSRDRPQPRLRRVTRDRDPAEGTTGLSRIQARTKPRNGSASSSWASSDSSPLNATRTTEQSSVDPMDRRKERTQPPTTDSNDWSQQHWSDDSSEPSVPSSTGGRLAAAATAAHNDRHHRHHRHHGSRSSRPHHRQSQSIDVEDEDEDEASDDIADGAMEDAAAHDTRDAREDAEHSIASPRVSLDSSTSSLYSFDTSRSDVSVGRHIHIPLLSVGQMAAKQGRPRWNV